MTCKIESLDELLRLLSKKTRQQQDYYGFGKMSERLDGVSQKYLYESLYKRIEKAKEKGLQTLPLNANKLNTIADFVGYDSFEKFALEFENKTPPQLANCSGTYYSYVRRNLREGSVYKSPVEITIRDGKAIMTLKGGRLMYSGEVKIGLGCLSVLLETKEGKLFHHVYKIGTSDKPEVLQGTFSGISNGFEPIAGRAVLIRKDELLKEMKNEELSLSLLQKSKLPEYKVLAHYFKEYEENNLTIKKAYSFRLEDLEG